MDWADVPADGPLPQSLKVSTIFNLTFDYLRNSLVIRKYMDWEIGNKIYTEIQSGNTLRPIHNHTHIYIHETPQYIQTSRFHCKFLRQVQKPLQMPW